MTTLDPRSVVDPPRQGAADRPQNELRGTTADSPRKLSLLEHGWWPVVTWTVGLALGAGALSDNSFLTHLATGRLIREHGAPMSDQFTWASGGRPIVVQSWLASWWYATLEAVGGATLIRVFVALTTALLMATLWRLTRPADALLGRLALVAVAGMVGLLWWNERPQLIAFAALALVALVITERRSPWWLVPLFALWVNVHGSFPLGILFVGCVVGTRVVSRRRPTGRDVTDVVATLVGVVAGAALSPYRFEMLTFPVKMLGRSSSLILIAEWRPISFDRLDNVVFVVEAVLILSLLVLRRQWVRLAGATLFVALAFFAVRNVAVAALVLVPIAAPALAGLGTHDTVPAPPRRRLLLAGGLVAVLGVGYVALTPDYDLSAYPTRAVDWMQAQGYVGHRSGRDMKVLTHDYDGNYLEWRYGPGSTAWIDDRAELHSFEDVRDYVALISDLGDTDEVLARHVDGDTIILWQAHTPLARRLAASPDYRVVYRDGDAIVACPVVNRGC